MANNFFQLIYLCFLFVSLPLAAQDNSDLYVEDAAATGPAFSLDEAQAYANKNGINAQNARLEIAVAQARLEEIYAGAYPQINANVGYQFYIQQPETLIPADGFGGGPDTSYYVNTQTSAVEQLAGPFPFDPTQPIPEIDSPEFLSLTFGTKHNLNAGISFLQQIYNGALFVGFEAAEVFVDLTKKQAQQSEIELKDAVAKAYFASLVAQENLEVLQKNVPVLERVLFETDQLYKNGFAEAIDVDRLRLSLSNIKTQIQGVQRQVELTQALLKFQMNYPLDAPIVLTDSLKDFVTDADEFYLQNIALKERIELDILDLQTRLNQIDVKQIRSQYLPIITAGGTLQAAFQDNEFNFWEKEQWIPSSFLNLGIQIPIFDGFMKRSQIQQRHVNARKLQNARSLQEQAIQLEIIQAQTAYLNALEQVENQKNNLDLAQRIYDTVLIKYKEGLGSSLEVTNAESSLFETQALYVNSLYDLVIAKSNIDKAAGIYQTN